MFSQMKDDGIPMGKLIALARDGPNVDKIILNELQQMVKDDYRKDSQISRTPSLGTQILEKKFFMKKTRKKSKVETMKCSVFIQGKLANNGSKNTLKSYP